MSQYQQQGKFSQRDQRADVRLTDQHQRPYHATIEKKSLDTTGVIQPLFDAPLKFEVKYFEKGTDPARPYDRVINYTRWLADIDADRREWERDGRIRSQRMYGEKYVAADGALGLFTQEVLDIVGPPPQHREPVLAARQGNAWILGFSKRVDLRLAKYFEPEQLDPTYRKTNEPDFSTVPEDEEDYTVLETAQDDARAAMKERDRLRKQRERESKRALSTLTAE